MFMCFIVANNLQSHVMKMIFLEKLSCYIFSFDERKNIILQHWMDGKIEN